MDEPQKNLSPIIFPSTRKFFQESRANKKHSLSDFIHGYIYGRWIYLYISVAKGRHPLTRILKPLFSITTSVFPKPKVDTLNTSIGNKTKITFADGYHGKVMPLEKASKLITVNKPINMPGRDILRQQCGQGFPG